MSFFLYRIRLLSSLLFFVYSLFLLQIQQVRVVIYTLILMLSILGSMFVHIQQTKIISETSQLKTVTLPEASPHTSQLFTQQAAETTYARFVSLQSMFLPHRDILFNVSLLADSMGKDMLSQENMKQAQKLDPNAAIFKK